MSKNAEISPLPKYVKKYSFLFLCNFALDNAGS